ncbi:MAG: phage antirepressor N-terminal domain-containing protein [Candidatus Promineifilaceae bacterium]
MSEEKALVPVEQKEVEFYGDHLIAVRSQGGSVFVPVRPICDLLGVNFDGQRRRINRDPVLSEEVMSVVVTTTDIDPSSRRPRTSEMLAIPLDYLSGFLFGINASRVKEEVRDRLIRYQRECYKVLDEAFREGRLTAEPSFDELLTGDSPAAMAYRIATALQVMARQQLLLESRIDQHDSQFAAYDERLEAIETQLGDPARYITQDQAMQLSQAVKTVAMKLSKASGRNEYGGVYGELYRKFGITSYKQLPAAKFDEAMNWLNEWREGIEGDVPF